jgi:protein CpxP
MPVWGFKGLNPPGGGGPHVIHPEEFCMKSVKQFLVAACAIASVSAGAYAATTDTSSTPAANAANGTQQWQGHRDHGQGHGGHGHHGGPFMGALKQLNLTAAQQQSVHSLLDSAKPQMQSLHQQLRTNGEALQSTPPDSSGYATLLATEKQLAAQGIQQRADLHTQIYAMLTPQQKAQLPQVLAAIKAKHEQGREQWKSRSGNTPAAS